MAAATIDVEAIFERCLVSVDVWLSKVDDTARISFDDISIVEFRLRLLQINKQFKIKTRKAEAFDMSMRLLLCHFGDNHFRRHLLYTSQLTDAFAVMMKVRSVVGSKCKACSMNRKCKPKLQQTSTK